MLKEKTNVNYKGRLKATHDVQEILETIAEGMDKTFAALMLICKQISEYFETCTRCVYGN